MTHHTTHKAQIALALSALLCLGACGNSAAPTTAAQPQTQAASTAAATQPASTAAAQPAISAETQSIGLEGVGNARQLGGYVGEGGRKVKDGLLLRSAALTDATEADIARLKDVYHLAELVDLRMTRETDAKPEIQIDGVQNVTLRIIDEEALNKKMAELDPEKTKDLDLSDKLDQIKMSMMTGLVSDQMYVDFLSSDTGKQGYTKLFQDLLALPEGRSLLFHCSQGKDRTGLAAMLILSALGVDEQTIMADFELTNVFNADLIEKERQMLVDRGYADSEINTMMMAMDQVNPAYMTNVLNWLKENYGSVNGYITKELGVTDAQIKQLQDKFLV